LQRRLTEHSGSECGDAPPDFLEAAALAGYHTESGHVRLLVCDDAGQFKLVATNWPDAGFTTVAIIRA
jgi:hypothetical protein